MILSVDLQQPLVRSFWRDRRPLVMACGCFDLLTVGHVRHLQEARRMGACLCVLVTADRHVGKPGRPIVPEDQRVELVDALRCVDFTVINPYPTAVEAIRCFAPEMYVKGRDHRDMKLPTEALLDETGAVLSAGGRLEFTGAEELHTTDVIEQIYKAECERRHWINLDNQHLLPT